VSWTSRSRAASSDLRLTSLRRWPVPSSTQTRKPAVVASECHVAPAGRQASSNRIRASRRIEGLDDRMPLASFGDSRMSAGTGGGALRTSVARRLAASCGGRDGPLLRHHEPVVNDTDTPRTSAALGTAAVVAAASGSGSDPAGMPHLVATPAGRCARPGRILPRDATERQ
jgi:hypothetical protein